MLNYYVNTIQGKDGDHLGDHVDKLFRLGQKMELPDGRIFRYCSAGESLIASTLQQSPVVHADYLDEASSTHAIDTNNFTLSTTTQAEAANAFQDGYLTYENADQLGGAAFIDRHGIIASGSPGTANGIIRGGVRWPVAVATAKKINQLKNTWAEIEQCDSPETSTLAGVVNFAIVSGDWGWCQTMGVCSCLVEGTVIAGQEVRAGETTDGSVTAMNYDEAGVADYGPIGRVVEVAASTEFGLIYLTVE
ncbi:MAG TPA: hypothetical protein ENI05_07230 [Porticoccus sp.]|nr:hypothetical protein [Porticoccus sp.]